MDSNSIYFEHLIGTFYGTYDIKGEFPEKYILFRIKIIAENSTLSDLKRTVRLQKLDYAEPE